MILSNISRAMREQNWFAVALEFVIVITGVVIGFQINAWNEARAEREIITRQLGEVRADLTADLASLEITRQASLWRVAAAEHLLTAIGDERAGAGLTALADVSIDRAALPEVTPADEPAVLARVNLVRGVTAARTGYESLVSAGHLRLIEDTALSAAIQRYYAGYENFEANLAIFRDIRASALPVLYANGFSPFSDQPIAPVIEAARADPALAAYFASCRELGVVQVDATREREADALALLALLDEALRL